MNILMVCLGNICRSPMAEGLLRKKIEDNNLKATVDSCGFEPFHVNDKPDKRAIKIAKNNNVDISNLKARLFKINDFDIFDIIYVMDYMNYNDVNKLARQINDKNKVNYILNEVYPDKNLPVPDPYYGSEDEFVKTWTLLDGATDKIIEKIKANYGAKQK